MNSYFPHDSNARNDAKILKVRMKYGAEGYGVYFMLLERLRDDSEYMSVKDYNMIAFDLRVDASLIKDIVENFGLFAFADNGECFYSESFNKRMLIKDEVSNKRAAAGKKGASKRWNGKAIAKPSSENSKAIAKPSEDDGNKSKVKESKVNKTKPSRAKSAQRTFAPDSEELQAAQRLWAKITANNPETKEPNLQRWADDLRLMHEQDNRSWDKINRMIKWSQADVFWSGVILSPKKLREKYDQMAAKANAEAREQAQPKSYGKPTRVEAKPDWLDKPYQPSEQSEDPALHEEIAAKLKHLQELRKKDEKGSKNDADTKTT